MTLHLYLIEITTFRVPRGAFNDGSHLKEKIIEYIVIYVTTYNGGQKCWDLSGDIAKTSDPSPPTPNKVEFGAKWVKLSAFLATTLLGEVGGTMG